jgi:hypothetical protein
MYVIHYMNVSPILLVHIIIYYSLSCMQLPCTCTSGFFLHRAKGGNLPPLHSLYAAYILYTIMYIIKRPSSNGFPKWYHADILFVRSRACLSIDLPPPPTPPSEISRKNPAHCDQQIRDAFPLVLWFTLISWRGCITDHGGSDNIRQWK